MPPSSTVPEPLFGHLARPHAAPLARTDQPAPLQLGPRRLAGNHGSAVQCNAADAAATLHGAAVVAGQAVGQCRRHVPDQFP